MTSHPANWTGQVLKERYLLGRRLGAGGMGEVYLAQDRSLNREVALKLVRLEGREAERAKHRFRAEAIAASRLNHPGIVRLFDFGREPKGPLYMVMELVRGQNLRQLLRRTGRISVHRAIRIILQVLDALEHAHRAGVIHRDLKPSNIMLIRGGQAGADEADRVKVCDFGVAKLLDPEDPEDPTGLLTLTRGGEILGSPAFMSPEQAAGGRVDARSDIFSAGLVLYTMLAGQKPFASDSVVALLHKVIHADPKPLGQHLSTLDPRIEGIVAKAMRKRPEERFGSVREMAESLQHVLETPELDDASTRLLVNDATTLDPPRDDPSFRDGDLSRTGSDPSALSGERRVRSTLGGGTRAWRAPTPQPVTVDRRPWRPALMLLGLGLTIGGGAWFMQRSTLPTVETLVAAASGPGFGVTERLALEGFREFRDDPRAVAAVATALERRRETELALLKDVRFKAGSALGLGAWSVVLDYNGVIDSARGLLTIEEVRLGSFTGMVDWPEHGSRASVVGYYDGNHLLFWEDELLLASEEARVGYRLHDKMSAYIVEDRLSGFVGMTRHAIRGTKARGGTAGGMR